MSGYLSTRAKWAAYFTARRRHPTACVAPVAFVREIGADPPIAVAYVMVSECGSSIVGFDSAHVAVWTRGVRFAP